MGGSLDNDPYDFLAALCLAVDSLILSASFTYLRVVVQPSVENTHIFQSLPVLSRELDYLHMMMHL